MHSLLSGPKFNNRHQTYVPGAEGTIRALKNAACITKIMLGEISPARPGLRRCKIKSIQGNLIELMYRDVNAVQIIRVTTSDIAEATSLIAKFTGSSDKKKPPSKSKKLAKPAFAHKSASKNRLPTPGPSQPYIPETLGSFFPSIEGLPPGDEAVEHISAERMTAVNAEVFPVIRRVIDHVLLNTYLKVDKSDDAIRWALELVPGSVIADRVTKQLGDSDALYSLAEIEASIEAFRELLGCPK